MRIKFPGCCIRASAPQVHLCLPIAPVNTCAWDRQANPLTMPGHFSQPLQGRPTELAVHRGSCLCVATSHRICSIAHYDAVTDQIYALNWQTISSPPIQSMQHTLDKQPDRDHMKGKRRLLDMFQPWKPICAATSCLPFRPCHPCHHPLEAQQALTCLEALPPQCTLRW